MTANVSAASPAMPLQQPKLEVYQKTDVGLLRDHNEDSSYSDPEGCFFIVADGMGGHAAGEVASQLAVDEVTTHLRSERGVLARLGADPNTLSRPVMTELLKRVGALANTAVRKRAREDRATRGMGTTLEMVCVTADGAWIGHVGDSRTYLVRGNSVTQLTTDHTVAQQLSAQKKLEMAEVLEEWGSVLVEAIGAKDEVRVEVIHCALQSGDRLLLCSDGLYEYFGRSDEIGEILNMEGSSAGLDRLVDLALDRGGKDNITGLLVEVVEAPVRVGPAVDTPNATSRGGLEYEQTLDSGAPVRDVADQGYGIDDAIALMRRVPQENPELVGLVVRKTLESAQIYLPPIIRHASSKQERLENRVALLKQEIADLTAEVAATAEEIAGLVADRDETSLVKERLELALTLGQPSGPGTPSGE